ncbi:hypothetical protein L596_020017 [Steinernema carpocapsae]|uniref:G-protein coupled receptors family 1 profile domain-containing protein n=1 Tax=Steinernema carpocapsae TaxID=34508 RepID=A0A4U5MSA6_STECR|nr:hypothetical protein L596_020017 [Steinernema carpocapsae]
MCFLATCNKIECDCTYTHQSQHSNLACTVGSMGKPTCTGAVCVVGRLEVSKGTYEYGKWCEAVYLGLKETTCYNRTRSTRFGHVCVCFGSFCNANSLLDRHFTIPLDSQEFISDPLPYVIQDEESRKASMAIRFFYRVTGPMLIELEFALSILSLIFNSLLLLLTIFFVPSSLAKTFCFHLCIQALISTVPTVFMGILERAGVFNRGPIQTGYEIVVNTCRLFSSNAYLYFATFDIATFYAGYKMPFFFQTILGKRKLINYVIAFLYISTILTTYFQNQNMFYNRSHLMGDYSGSVYTVTTIMFACYLVMLGIYFLTLYEIVAHRLCAPGNVKTKNLYWSNLKAILLYCTTPNILSLATLTDFVADIVYQRQMETMEAFDAVDRYKLFLSENVISYTSGTRMLVTSFSVFIAFKDYRRLVFVAWTRVKNVGSKIKALPIFNPPAPVQYVKPGYAISHHAPVYTVNTETAVATEHTVNL